MRSFVLCTQSFPMVFLSPPNSNGLPVCAFQARTNPPLTRALAAGSAPMSRAFCICRGANDARRRSLLRDAKPHNRWRPYAVAAGGVVEWKVRLARGHEAATWRELIDRVLVVASTPFLTPRARLRASTRDLCRSLGSRRRLHSYARIRRSC